MQYCSVASFKGLETALSHERVHANNALLGHVRISARHTLNLFLKQKEGDTQVLTKDTLKHKEAISKI
jgi:hypothetical protein